MKKTLAIILAVATVLSFASGCGSPSGVADPSPSASSSVDSPVNPSGSENIELPQVTLSWYLVWNGSSATAPDDIANNPVADAIREKLGITFDFQYATSAESDLLNTIFASGDLPDMINSAYWGGLDPTTMIFKKAAKEGQLYAFNDVIDQFPNVKRSLTEGVSKDFREFDLEDPAFSGNLYILPWQTVLTQEDTYNPAVSIFAREDILNELGVKPNSVTTSEEIYELLLKIKNGNFKDANGNAVIPSGCWSNGWPVDLLFNSYSNIGFATGYSLENGRYTLNSMTENMDKSTLFMRKLISQGLLDPECFRQTDSVAREKLANGTIAVLPSMFSINDSFFPITLYMDHPEMRYVPLGPIMDGNGTYYMPGQVNLAGRAGTPCNVITKACKNPLSALAFLDFSATPEGQKLLYYGIEGVHHTLVDGQPRLTEEWLDIYNNDKKRLYDDGLCSSYTWAVALDCRSSVFGEASPGASVNEVDPDYALITQMYPLVFKDGIRITYLASGYPNKDDIDALVMQAANLDLIQSAYFANSDEEALKIINGIRDQLIKGGINDFLDYINEQTRGRDDILT